MGAKVLIAMGSDSDLDVMLEAAGALESLEIEYEIVVTSAHRSPHRTVEMATTARDRGLRVIIAGAGGAAHLAGVFAATTTLPVIGVPIHSTPLGGIDALLATAQMPSGVPVATMAVGKAGAFNAGILAAQILGVADETAAKALERYKTKLEQSVAERNQRLAEKLAQKKGA